MNRIIRISTIGFAACLLVCSLIGCATSSGRRYYSGDLRPSKDVAIFIANNRVRVDTLTEEGKPKKNLSGEIREMGELLPGNYVLLLRISDIGTYSITAGNHINLPLHAEPGHIYYIFQEYPTPNSWRPVVVDIGSDSDYENIKKVGELKRIDTDSPNDVRRWIQHYLTGERLEIKETVVQTKDGTVSLWR